MLTTGYPALIQAIRGERPRAKTALCHPERKHWARGMCTNCYHAARRIPAPPRPTPRQRFWARTVVTGFSPGACWLYTGSTINGYGQIRVGRKKVLAHIFSCELAGRYCPDDLEHSHLCASRNCVNPDHIVFETHRENMARRAA